MADRSRFTRATASGNLQSLVTNYNSNLDTLEQELENTLNRKDNVLPNHMEDDIDMDSHRIFNMADGELASDAVTLRQLSTALDTYELGPQDKIDFKTSTAATPATARLVWNETDGTLDLGLKGGNVVLQIGQEQVIRAANKTGATLLEGAYQCVKISGAQGQRPKIALARADNDLNSADTVGLVTETILNNQEGFITTSGLVRGIDTTGTSWGESWTDGDVLYLSGVTSGRLTNVKPQAPTHTVIVGFVIYAHANHGTIYVKVDNGYEIDELHNVKIDNVADKNVLRYNTSLGVWENIAQTALTAGIANTVDNTNSASNLSFWTGSQGQYDALTPDSNTLYFIT